MGPKRDLVAPLVAACRNEGLKFGFYQSLEEWEYPITGSDGKLTIRKWSPESGDSEVPYDAAAMKGKIAGKRPVHDYTRDYLVPQTKEFIRRYDPDLLWFDGDWTEDAGVYDSYQMVADYYNQAEGRKDVAVNDRLGESRGKAGDFYTSEYGDKSYIRSAAPHKWEENRGISQSFGYNRNDTEANIISAQTLIQMLVTIVSRNGNLLLIVNLDGNGALPEIQRGRLREVGHWLAVNGEAIYSTRPWTRSDAGERIRFTRSKDGSCLYAICFDWPSDNLTLPGVKAAEGSVVEFLGTGQPLGWKQEGNDLVIAVPGSLSRSKPCAYAYAVKIPLQKPM
jgi:alpha-L-fucosidase